MPLVFRLPIQASVSGLPVVPLDQPPIMMPDLWPGMQCWLDSSYGFTNPQIASDDAVALWRNNWVVQWIDAADRVRWKDQAIRTHNYAFRLNPTGANNGMPIKMVTSPLGAKFAIRSQDMGHVVYITGETDADANTALMTQTYTMVCLFRVAAGANQGLFGQSATKADTDSQAGLRAGFITSPAPAFVFQHNNLAANRLEITRDLANGTAAYAIVTCKADHTGKVYLKQGGSLTSHPFSFAAGVDLSTAVFNAKLSVGKLGATGSTPPNDIFLFGKWNRVLTDTELTNLQAFLLAQYGI